MLISKGVKSGKINRFEMMKLAEKLADLYHQSLLVDDLSEIEYDGENFVISTTTKATKKDIMLSLSKLVSSLLKLTNKRLTSIFVNHYLACLNDKNSIDFLPKNRKKQLFIVCGGLSGSGKSRVAREIAPNFGDNFGALIIRDDIVRKQIEKVSFDTELDETYYTPEKEQTVYRRMRCEAKRCYKAGYSVIVEGLFYNSEERIKIENLAKQLGAPFYAFWLEAPLGVRALRIEKRKNNPSDMKKKEDLIKQYQMDVSEVRWTYILTQQNKDKTVSDVLKKIK